MILLGIFSWAESITEYLKSVGDAINKLYVHHKEGIIALSNLNKEIYFVVSVVIYYTLFPINNEAALYDLIGEAKNWLLSSPHTNTTDEQYCYRRDDEDL